MCGARLGAADDRWHAWCQFCVARVVCVLRFDCMLHVLVVFCVLNLGWCFDCVLCVEIRCVVFVVFPLRFAHCALRFEFRQCANLWDAAARARLRVSGLRLRFGGRRTVERIRVAPALEAFLPTIDF